MNNFDQPLITVDELCELLMIGKTSAYELLRSGKIQSFKIGRIWKIPRESIQQYIHKQIQFAVKNA